MYIGTTCVEPPTAKPRKIRATIRVQTSGAKAQAEAPTTNTALTIMVQRRRPYFSDRPPAMKAPMIAPSRMAEVTISCMLLLRWKSLLINSSAPEMMPVS